MPLTTNFGSLQRLGKQFDDLATQGSKAQDALLEAMKPEVSGVLRYQFANSVDPYGTPWQTTKRGKPALLSRKWPQAFTMIVREGRLFVVDRTPRHYAVAHQLGHVFAARNVARGGITTTQGKRPDGSTYDSYNKRGVVLFFGKRGKLLKHKAGFAREDGKNLRFGRAVFARAHRIGQRVLPARRLLPDGSTLPPMWQQALERGATAVLLKWAARAGLT